MLQNQSRAAPYISDGLMLVLNCLDVAIGILPPFCVVNSNYCAGLSCLEINKEFLVWNDKDVGKMVTAVLAVASLAVSHNLNQVLVEIPKRSEVLQNRRQTENKDAC